MSKYSKNIPPSIIGAIGWFYDDIPEGSTVLDVGCSTGYYGAYIRKHKKCLVYGIEPSEDQKEARKVLDGVYSFDLDGEWPKEIYERKYDVVFLGDVIEHLKDPGRTIENIQELLAQDGRVYISTPNIAHISIRLELLGGNFEYESMGILDNTHLKYFTLNSLSGIVHKAGYDIVRIDSSESDYPREVATNLLEQYGLKPSKKFWDMMAEPTARAFQYKLVIKPTKKGQKHKPDPAPAKKPEQYKADYISNLNDQITKQNQQFIELSSTLEALRKDNDKTNQTLNAIVNSKAYKVAQKMQRTAKIVRKHSK